MRISTIILLFSFLVSAPALSDEAADEEAVWALEESYWEYAKDNDIRGYLTLWDDNFIGWPGFSRTAMEKDRIASWIAPLHSDPTKIWNYKLTRGAVRSFGDIVATHYLIQGSYRSSETGELVLETPPSRITHTWQRRGDTWQIITGMSGTLITDSEE